MAYSNTLLTQGNFSGELSALGPVMIGENNSVDTEYLGNENSPTLVEGFSTSATNQGAYGLVGGKYAELRHPFAFVWNGSEEEGSYVYNQNNPFISKGEGTFAVNSKTGLDGFFVGEKNMTTHMNELSGYTKSILENTTKTDSTVNNVVHKGGTETIGGAKTFNGNVIVNGSGSSISIGSGINRTVLSSGKVDLYRIGTATNEPSVDFHFNNTSTATSRIYESESGKITINASLKVLKDASISSSIYAQGASLTNLRVNTTTSVGNITVNSGSSIKTNSISPTNGTTGSLKIDGHFFGTLNASIGGNILVNGNSSVRGSLFVNTISTASSIVVDSSVKMIKGASIAGSLIVAGNSSITGRSDCSSMYVSNIASIAGNLHVNGTSSLNNITLGNEKIANLTLGSVFVKTQAERNYSSLVATTAYVDHAIDSVESGTFDANGFYRGNNTFAGSVTLSSTNVTNGVDAKVYFKTQDTTDKSSLAATTQFAWNVASSIGSTILNGKTAIGSTSVPVYVNGSSICQLTANVGGQVTTSGSESITPVYLNGGSITAVTTTVGSSLRPVYVVSGSIKVANPVLHVAENETITGVKTFSTTINSTVATALLQKNTYVTKPTIATTNYYRDIAQYVDNDGRPLSRIYTEVMANSTNSISLLAYKPSTTDNTYTKISCGYNSAGKEFTYAPTPATTDNSTQIATTAFVNRRLANAGTIKGTSIESTGNLSVAGSFSGNCIEFSNTNSTSNHGGYIDFHWNGSTSDYTSRIIEDANGKINITSSLSLTTKPAVSNSTTSNVVPTIGWVNDPNYSTNVVHRSGVESASGAKTFLDTLTLSKTTDAAGNADNKPALIVGGASTSSHIEIDSNEILAKTNGTTPGDLWLQDSVGGRVMIGCSVAADSATTNQAAATVGWVNDSTKSTNVVHRSGAETISGSKSFTANTSVKSTILDRESTTTSKYTANFSGIDKNDKEIGYITFGGTKDTWGMHLCVCDKTGSLKSTPITLDCDSSGNVNAIAITPSSSNSSIANNIATVGWVNDPNYSTNVVHRSGNESIAGTKTFTKSNTSRFDRDGISSSWVTGRSTSMIRMTSVDSYSPFISQKTTDGTWELGTYKVNGWDNVWLMTYISDENFNSGTNSITAQYKFPADVQGNVATREWVSSNTIKGVYSIKGSVASSASLNFTHIPCISTPSSIKITISNIGGFTSNASLGEASMKIGARDSWTQTFTYSSTPIKLYMASASLVLNAIAY